MSLRSRMHTFCSRLLRTRHIMSLQSLCLQCLLPFVLLNPCSPLVKLHRLIQLNLLGNPLNSGFYPATDSPIVSMTKTGVPRSRVGNARIGPAGNLEIRDEESQESIIALCRAQTDMADYASFAELTVSCRR